MLEANRFPVSVLRPLRATHTARAVILGFNAMVVDSDTIPMSNIYWLLHRPPLAPYAMLSQAEAGTAINGGFSYVRGASSSGPVAWMMQELICRTARVYEDGSALNEVLGDQAGECGVQENNLARCAYAAVSRACRKASLPFGLEAVTPTTHSSLPCSAVG